MKYLVAALVPASLLSATAFGECSNLVLKMKDTKSDREITTILDCHDASATIPGATTMHFMEWKDGGLCQSIQNCGNVNFWKGTLSIGANWYWGNSLTKFMQVSDSLNKFAQTAQDISQGGNAATSGGVYRCADFSRWSEFERGSYVKSTSGYYMDSSMYGQFNSEYCKNSNPYGPYNSSMCNGIALGGSQSNGYFVQGEGARSWLASSGASANVLTCGYLDESFAQSYNQQNGSIMSLDKGKLVTKGGANTDWHTDGIHANFALDFGQINRSCSVVRDFGCL